MCSIDDVQIHLTTAYHELNSQTPDELNTQPSPLEFMRYVARNRPFVIRAGVSDWKAVKAWDVEYLRTVIGDNEVNVAITPSGNADSVVQGADGSLLFAKPMETTEKFTDFLDYVRNQQLEPTEGEVRYAQTQNDNLRGEYKALFQDVEKDIAWARIALEKEPDAINMWIGNSKSVSALHRDNYENIYCQIIGRKHFILLPPTDVACVRERELTPATYSRTEEGRLALRQDEGAEKVPFATWDPEKGGHRGMPLSELARPMRVTLEEGDVLYLPTLWYHKVSQSCSEEGICIAVNYWYDMEFGGSFYPMSTFVRDVALLAMEGENKLRGEAKRSDN